MKTFPECFSLETTTLTVYKIVLSLSLMLGCTEAYSKKQQFALPINEKVIPAEEVGLVEYSKYARSLEITAVPEWYSHHKQRGEVISLLEEYIQASSDYSLGEEKTDLKTKQALYIPAAAGIAYYFEKDYEAAENYLSVAYNNWDFLDKPRPDEMQLLAWKLLVLAEHHRGYVVRALNLCYSIETVLSEESQQRISLSQLKNQVLQKYIEASYFEWNTIDSIEKGEVKTSFEKMPYRATMLTEFPEILLVLSCDEWRMNTCYKDKSQIRTSLCGKIIKPIALSSYFNSVPEEQLEPDQRLFLEICRHHGALTGSPGRYTPSSYVILLNNKPKPESEKDVGISRKKSFCHELVHYVFSSDERFKEAVVSYWDTLESSLQQEFKSFLEERGYNPNNTYSLLTEFAAYGLTEPYALQGNTKFAVLQQDMGLQLDQYLPSRLKKYLKQNSTE